MKAVKNSVLIISAIFWPLSLFLNNTPSNFMRYILFLFEPKLVIFPILFIIFYFLISRKINRIGIFLLFFFLVLFLVNFKSFYGQTIFKKDYEAQQAVLRQTLLYPKPLLARTFHNKARIFIDKFNNNFFALTDPGNYFFRFHPRQIIVDNQNLKKFPSLSLPFVLVGIYFILENRQKIFIVSFAAASLLNLSVLSIFDRHDFILWVPIMLLLVHGVNIVSKKNKNFFKIYSFIFLVFSFFEIVQILVQ